VVPTRLAAITREREFSGCVLVAEDMKRPENRIKKTPAAAGAYV
jgi:hypothetical protein